ncbi:three-Cys-motif partner protein [Sphingomonas sp. YR710]|uniref:three-Cys-motif partner protein TcmP n=1 Tax=Sphingomonas sp. YR710 TaxID=1882773 RepID=UPI0008842E6D|nr:three-Cys-motif partner protein TcmP [Sphingomonas sp. YR710]SDC53803.1 three-Cys-motif partner protein [Sphingomonas sp. YR710]
MAAAPPERNFRSLRHPLWTQNKAHLIRDYLKLFTMVTRHGTYIDGFAAPQESDHPEMWSAKLVLENNPKWMRDFWLCDLSAAGATRLEALAVEHRTSQRRISVLPGDFNTTIDEVLASPRIKETTATFALLDQRTFECSWETVRKLALRKTGRKIELFYFFATGWVDRSIAAVGRDETAAKVERWWGRSDWRSLQGMESVIRAKMVAARFKDELGYGYAYPYAIHNARRGGRTMYHMIHATDHPDAPPLMIRAYRRVSGRPEIEGSQLQGSLDDHWGALEE